MAADSDAEAATTKETVDRNIKTLEQYVTRATNGFPGVELVVFPEYSSHGFGFDPYATHLKLAETIPGESTQKMGAIAKKFNTWLCVSIVEKNSDPEQKPYNSIHSSITNCLSASFSYKILPVLLPAVELA